MHVLMRLVLAASLFGLVACTESSPYADDATVAAVSYRDPGPATLTLYTMVNNRTGAGGHSSLMINASERIIFDPAGSFYADIVPEQKDVLFGITPAVEKAYRGSHARSTHHVIYQTVEVTPEQAETAYRLARQNKAVAGGFCASATAGLLRQVPGFESVKSTMSPTKLAAQFETFPGVRTEKHFEDDDGNLLVGLEENNRRLNAQ